MPVHQPADHEDDEDQAEDAPDPDGSTLTVIAAAVEPKSASEKKHEQHDKQNQFHRSSSISLSAVRAERRLVPSREIEDIDYLSGPNLQ